MNTTLAVSPCSSGRSSSATPRHGFTDVDARLFARRELVLAAAEGFVRRLHRDAAGSQHGFDLLVVDDHLPLTGHLVAADEFYGPNAVVQP